LARKIVNVGKKSSGFRRLMPRPDQACADAHEKAGNDAGLLG